MREPEMDQIADLIARALSRIGDEKALAAIADDVTALCRRFPLYPTHWSDAD
jgi:glycine/serine hydroxymethyltransferase